MYGAGFPLTLALSLGERELRIPIWESSMALINILWLALFISFKDQFGVVVLFVD